MGYFLFRQGVTYGPFSVAQMSTFVAEGRVLLSDFAKTEAMVQWQPLQAIWNQPVALPGPIAGPVPPPPIPAPATRGNLLSWPFHQRAWFTSLWMILLWWFPVPLIPVGAILCIGWSVDAARRWSSKAADLLPRSQNFGRMFLDGLTVVFFFCFYLLIPVTLAWMATQVNTLSFAIPVIKWAWHYLQGQKGIALQDLLSGILVQFLVQRAAIIVYLMLGWPIFTAAGIRLVLSREATSFFPLPACVGLLFRHFWSFVKFLLLTWLAAVTVAIGDALLVSSGV